jgi:FAD/FMN-containing dehydrogenase
MATVPALTQTDHLLDDLDRILGAEGLLTGEEDRRFHATDVFAHHETPVAVARPATVEQLQAVVAACAAARAPVQVRGGGASYTEGYTHSLPGGVTIDTSRLKRIVVDELDAIVTVEAGVTWAELRDALMPKGWRTPFWGPFSGLMATVAGSMSQHSVSHGTGTWGVSAESLVALDVVTGTGELLRTGSGGSPSGHPFFRFYGPDLAGLFTGDCGALGVKARVTLKMIRRREAFEALSFRFDDFAAMHTAMRAVAIEVLDDENFGLDATLQQGQLGKQEGVAAKAEIAKSVMKSAGSFGAGVKALAKMAVAGDRDLRNSNFAVHYIVEGVEAADARARAALLRRLASAHGEEIANTVPTVVRSMPFAPLTNTLGPKGERWVPFHAQLPHSQVIAFHAALERYWEANRAVMEQHAIVAGRMFMSVGPNDFIYEPTFYWPDERTVYHARVVPAEHLKSVAVYPRNEAARAEATRLKSEIIDLMHAHGAAHFQVGRVYPYLRGRNDPSVALLRAIKTALDPHGILGPGVLGL